MQGLERIAKKARVDLVRSEDGRHLLLNWTLEFLACSHPCCINFDDYSDAHCIINVDLPGRWVNVEEGERLGPVSVCATWLDERNAERDEWIKRNHEWRCACRMLICEYPWLVPALGAFKEFARRFFPIPPAISLSK